MKPKLLIVDDDDEIRTQLKWALSDEYAITLAGDRDTATASYRNVQPVVVLLDLGLPPSPNTPTEGLATLAAILHENKSAKVIILSGQNEKETAIHAVGAGAYDFLCKPADITELKLLLKRCCHVAQLEAEYRQLQESRNTDAFEGMLGTSPRMQTVFDTIRKVAPSDANVLLLGESGTGKEMAALAIHRRSPRRAGPFVAINCGAIPETLLESELFGHEKGAFTGAHTQRKGRIENAEGGTLFLDEIGEMPLPLQVKLLRFLQEQTIERVGGRAPIHVEARVIAATNTDLTQAMAAGKFREDLYYRLAVVTLALPPLRERGEDVILLAQTFLQRFAAEAGKRGLAFSVAAVRALTDHTWPGNVRELENRVRRAVIMAEGKRLQVHDLELDTVATGSTIPTLREAREHTERELVVRALERHHGKIAPAAAELGISRPTMYELMEKLGIARKTEKNEGAE